MFIHTRKCKSLLFAQCNIQLQAWQQKFEQKESVTCALNDQ